MWRFQIEPAQYSVPLFVLSFETRRQKAIPWDTWDWERSISMNCEVKLIATIIS